MLQLSVAVAMYVCMHGGGGGVHIIRRLAARDGECRQQADSEEVEHVFSTEWSFYRACHSSLTGKGGAGVFRQAYYSTYLGMYLCHY